MAKLVLCINYKSINRTSVCQRSIGLVVQYAYLTGDVSLLAMTSDDELFNELNIFSARRC